MGDQHDSILATHLLKPVARVTILHAELAVVGGDHLMAVVTQRAPQVLLVVGVAPRRARQRFA